MTWTDIDNTVFDTGEPTAGIHLKQMNDNFDAMANGDTGAPKIQKAALSASVQASLDAADAFTDAPVAGATFVQKRMGDSPTRALTSGNIFVTGYSGSASNLGVPMAANAFKSGVITCSYDRVTSDSDVFTEIIRNGTTEQSSNGAAGSVSQDISVTKGDTIYFRVRAVGSASGTYLTGAKITTGNNVLGVI